MAGSNNALPQLWLCRASPYPAICRVTLRLLLRLLDINGLSELSMMAMISTPASSAARAIVGRHGRSQADKASTGRTGTCILLRMGNGERVPRSVSCEERTDVCGPSPLLPAYLMIGRLAIGAVRPLALGGRPRMGRHKGGTE